jgi:uncharacterized radical SAM protein YgiQ
MCKTLKIRHCEELKATKLMPSGKPPLSTPFPPKRAARSGLPRFARNDENVVLYMAKPSERRERRGMRTPIEQGFLPINRADMTALGWEAPDFLLVTGDAYVDHPSFGAALIARVLTAAGYRVSVLAQPDWRSAAAFAALGAPRLAALATGGNLDSLVNHYTAAKKRRSGDAYSAGGQTGKRPDRAALVYANRLREAFPETPIILGGLEASLRRLAHYDYWSGSVRRALLADCPADLLVYGMGERPILEIAGALEKGKPIGEIRSVRGTCYFTRDVERIREKAVLLPSYAAARADKRAYAEACRLAFENQDPITAKALIQPHPNGYLVQNPPMPPLSRRELDAAYELPFTRAAHPYYEKKGGVPALEEVKFSLTSARGCFGACNFCALTFHQGRGVVSRSHESLLAEAKALTKLPDFKGYIHDVGGPTANFRANPCEKMAKAGACKDRRCLFPKPCPNLKASHADFLALLEKLRKIEGVKKAFIRSGIRYDYLLADPEAPAFMRALCENHVSGQLKVAPEHICESVLQAMGKPPFSVYERFREAFAAANRKLGKAQYLVPYLMSAHPGSGLREAIELARYLKKNGLNPKQVQDFYPTPGTVSTCMFHTGLDPQTMKPVYAAKSAGEKARQRALLQCGDPKNYALVLAALKEAGREDLIGFSKDCLIKPPRARINKEREKKKRRK